MKPITKVIYAAVCATVLGHAFSVLAQNQLPPHANQLVAEASDGDGETDDDAPDAGQTQVTEPPTQQRSQSEQRSTTLAEPPGGDGDGETNDDG